VVPELLGSCFGRFLLLGRLEMIGRTEQLRQELGADLEDLLDACTAADKTAKEAAWTRLLEEVRRMAVDLARRSYHLGVEDAEDVAQLAQLRVLEHLSQLRRPAAFPLWVRRVVHHLVLDTLRQRRPVLSLDAPVTSDGDSEGGWGETLAEPAAEEAYDQVLMRIDLDRALARLPELYRDPIRLHVLQGLPQDEVGRRLGRPRSTVATQIERGLHRLRRTMPGMAAVAA
jgi:RNA polymerase sigma-70 factor, ECF subfamily